MFAPFAIHRLLREDPSLFATLVGFMYKRDDNAVDPTQESMDEKTRQKLAHNARSVVDSWRLLPGVNDDGSVDENQLTQWVDAARAQCAVSRHVTGGDIQLGFVLARMPRDRDGTWPHTAVRNLIERLNNDVIDQHIQIEVFNSRGVVSRGLLDGGAQEKALADGYRKMGEAVQARWPRTAALLRQLANSYSRYAEHEDIESELNDLRLG